MLQIFDLVCSLLPFLSLRQSLVHFLPLSMLLNNSLVSNGSSQVLLCFLVPLSLLPSHVDEIVLVGNHVSLVTFLNLLQHFVFVHTIEASQQNPVLVSIHKDVHADFNGFSAGFAGIAV